MKRVDHTWTDPVAMEGRFSYDMRVLRIGIFTDGEPKIPFVGRLCFLSLLHGCGTKFVVKPPTDSNWPPDS